MNIGMVGDAIDTMIGRRGPLRRGRGGACGGRGECVRMCVWMWEYECSTRWRCRMHMHDEHERERTHECVIASVMNA